MIQAYTKPSARHQSYPMDILCGKDDEWRVEEAAYGQTHSTRRDARYQAKPTSIRSGRAYLQYVATICANFAALPAGRLLLSASRSRDATVLR